MLPHLSPCIPTKRPTIYRLLLSLLQNKPTDIMASSSSTDIDGLEQLMNELVEICESRDLSIESLQAKIKLLPSHTSSAYVHHYASHHPFFHAACMNKNITLGIIEYLLDAFPLVQNLTTAYFCPDLETTSYALHCACYNNNCPNEVIKLQCTAWFYKTACKGEPFSCTG